MSDASTPSHWLGPSALLLAVFAALGGCAGSDAARATVRVRAERDLDCPPDEIHLREELGGVFHVQGCGRATRYRAICDGVRCAVAGEGEPLTLGRDSPPMR